MIDGPAEFQIRVDPGEQPATRRIVIVGELDSGTCGQLAGAFERELASPQLAKLVLDLSGLTFVDSAGTRMLILLERQAGERGTEVDVVPAPEEVTALLRLSGLVDRMNLVEAPDVATESGEFLERIDSELVREPTAPAQARSEVRQVLAAIVDESDLATVVLLTSELVTNAVIHPRNSDDRRVGFRMTIYPDRIRVLVDDPGDGFDPATPIHPSEDGGRGLMLVDRASARWGAGRVATARGDRFGVWFDIERDRSPAEPLGA